MSVESPLFQSSMELFCHAMEHFNSGKELDRKLVIIHLANSVELILKDLILDKGLSIYKGPKETISIQSAISTIKTELKIDLSYLNKIELLIDERNGLQHRFGSPNQVCTFYYMNETFEFMANIMNRFFGEDFGETLTQYCDPKVLSGYFDLVNEESDEYTKILKVAQTNAVTALLKADLRLEEIIKSFMQSHGLSTGVSIPRYNMRSLIKEINVPAPISKILDEMKIMTHIPHPA